jgi:hypothetical protein
MVGLRPSGLMFVVFVVNRNRIQIFCFKYLIAIKTPDVIYPVAPVKEFGSLVLTTWHSEISLF